MNLGVIKKAEAPLSTGEEINQSQGGDVEIKPGVDIAEKPKDEEVKSDIFSKDEDNSGLSAEFTNQNQIIDASNPDIDEVKKPAVDLEKAGKMVFGNNEINDFKDFADKFNQIVY
ncbi:MAG: hypothetical protein UR93_C0001G0008 [Berkelbacteria bacterium GW2011_GWA2_35_9]|uniref:Uncharacterized protein n=1 Tax=Berkelbacteria bacterium GW2011_GWA2_35_9 TaxID=1618333 RepID=A0A0G0DK57_9BACT|nr:MAG: hypothetical protein UR93_C0001G0008 [Berkelbacteria bacterium GW2011_GWA2_35_9]